MKSDSLCAERLVASRQGKSQHWQRLEWLLLLLKPTLEKIMLWQSSFGENHDTVLLKIKKDTSSFAVLDSTDTVDPSPRACIHMVCSFL